MEHTSDGWRRPLRLLYVQPATNIGGAERQASLVLPELPAYGVHPTAVAGPGGAIVEWFQRHGVPSFLWSRHFPGGGPFSMRKLPAYVTQLTQLLGELDELHRKTPFDVVVGSLGYGWAVSGLFGRRWNVPVLWRAGGLSLGATSDPQSTEAMGVRLLARLLRPQLLLCNAEAVQRYWDGILGLPMAVIPNGVIVPETIQRRTRTASDPLILGFMGRLAPEKGLPMLFESVAVARSHGVDVRLRLAGPGDVGLLRERLARLGIEQHAEVLGRVDDLARFYSACDALVLPSVTEGCANVLLEAMAHGVPPVATAVGGTPEVVEDEVNGLLVAPRSPWALSNAIERLARDPGLTARLGEAGRAKVEAHTPKASARVLAEALRRAVATSSRAISSKPRAALPRSWDLRIRP